jgi:DNA polymerase-3 subunit chi
LRPNDTPFITGPMTEILFYHLERKPLEAILPELLEKSVERGWRSVVRAGSEERVEALDAHLWTYREEGFLPHGTRKDGAAASQPIWLTSEDENPNRADVLFVVDGAAMGDPGPYRRVVLLFDGQDPDRLAEARAAWSSTKAAGHDVTYWKESPSGRWEKQA